MVEFIRLKPDLLNVCRLGFFLGAFAFFGIGSARRILGRHWRVDFFTPSLQPREQFLGFFGLLLDQVFLLADVTRQVVEFEVPIFEILDHFPIARANRAAGCGAPGIRPLAQVAREMPEDRAVRST